MNYKTFAAGSGLARWYHPRMKKIVVLISGRGSNMLALARASMTAGWPGRIAAVIADRDEAKGCEAARLMGLPVETVAARSFPDKPAFFRALGECIDAQAPDLVVLAGFMRILPPDLVDRLCGRLINIHPSLLPAFPGLHTHQRVLESGARVHGATVHYVTAQLDAGPIILQAAVPVLAGDDESALAARVLLAEHQILPLAVRWHLEGRLTVAAGRVSLGSPRAGEAQWIWAP